MGLQIDTDTAGLARSCSCGSRSRVGQWVAQSCHMAPSPSCQVSESLRTKWSKNRIWHGRGTWHGPPLPPSTCNPCHLAMAAHAKFLQCFSFLFLPQLLCLLTQPCFIVFPSQSPRFFWLMCLTFGMFCANYLPFT